MNQRMVRLVIWIVVIGMVFSIGAALVAGFQ
jgi:hypothetical protein